jgi:hypothetical protein
MNAKTTIDKNIKIQVFFILIIPSPKEIKLHLNDWQWRAA